MKKLSLFLCFLFCFVTFSFNGQINHDLSFTIRNFGVNVQGDFGESTVEGSVVLENPEQTVLKASIEVNSIDTGNQSRDEHLLEDDYFDVANYPLIVFVSSSFKTLSASNYELRGTLKIKGTTKEVIIPLQLEQATARKTLKGSLSINRKDFNVGGSSFILSKTVNIYLTIEVPRS